jgi:hypothetical protein
MQRRLRTAGHHHVGESAADQVEGGGQRLGAGGAGAHGGVYPRVRVDPQAHGGRGGVAHGLRHGHRRDPLPAAVLEHLPGIDDRGHVAHRAGDDHPHPVRRDVGPVQARVPPRLVRRVGGEQGGATEAAALARLQRGAGLDDRASGQRRRGLIRPGRVFEHADPVAPVQQRLPGLCDVPAERRTGAEPGDDDLHVLRAVLFRHAFPPVSAVARCDPSRVASLPESFFTCETSSFLTRESGMMPK